MILTKLVQVKPNSKTLFYYRNLGYECTLYSKIIVPVEHLTKGSHQIIDVKCDFCEQEKKLDYNSYWRNTKGLKLPYSCSEKCGMDKRNNTNIEKYGVKNVFENKNIKEKIKKSYVKNLNVTHPSKSIEIQQTIKTTNLKRYGFTCSLLNKKIKEKIESSCLKKYGVKNPLQNKKGYLTKKNKILEKYKYDGLIDIKNGIYIIKCNKGHIVELEKSVFHNRIKYKTILCTECNPIGDYHRSGLETQISDFITNAYVGKIELNKKFGHKEIDIYLPDLKLAFEINGVYWHNELNKSIGYHQEKTDFCESKGIRLIHIYEDDWVFKQEIVKSLILNSLNESNDCTILEYEIRETYDVQLIKNFLEKNHIQGFVESKINIGLFHNDELFSLMTFGYLNIENTYEMLRYCSKLNTNILYTDDKLFDYFIKKYMPSEIITYIDRSWLNGLTYEKLGFNLLCKTPPNCYYVIDRKRYHTNLLKNDDLIEDKKKHDIKLNEKVFRIYDSGYLKYSFTSH